MVSGESLNVTGFALHPDSISVADNPAERKTHSAQRKSILSTNAADKKET